MNRGGPLVESIYLKPGELTVAERPALVCTVLGSCVALTLFSPRLRVGAICHAMLPSGECGGPFKYVDSSVRHMLEQFERLRIKRSEIVVKLFGGADMFDAASPNRSPTVGRQNIQFASETLRQEGLQLVGSDVGGRQGRKLLFYTHTGEVLLKRLAKQRQSLAG